MESIIRDHILDHFFSNNLFSYKQYGFLPSRSTVIQLLKILDEWTNDLDFGKQIDVIYMDFEKAFDKGLHYRLVSELKSYGLADTLVNWIYTFLCDMKQRVGVNGVYSEWCKVESRIPQGSILGPLLFLIYINDLPDFCTETHTHTHTTVLLLAGICPGPPGSAGSRKVKPRRLKPIWIYWSKR